MSNVKTYWQKYSTWLVLALVIVGLLRIWTISGYDSLNFDTDIARDLEEISKIQAGTVVWLGPWLGPGLHASSIYYYYFYPAMELTNGRIFSFIDFNVMTGLVSILFFGVLATYKYRFKGVVGTAFLGMVPMMTDNILHPGNGFTYMYFVMVSLTALWFSLPLWIGSLAAGMAGAFHPATGFLPVFVFSEWWQRGRSWRSALLSGAAFLVPLAPIIAFEIITKGYIIRNWLSHPSSNNISIEFSLFNLQQVAHLLGFSLSQLLLLLIIVAFLIFSNKSAKPKIWLGLTVFFLVFILFFSNLLWRYLFGIAMLVLFMISVTFIKYRVTTLILLACVCSLFYQSPIMKPVPAQGRTMSEVQSIAQFIDAAELLDPAKKTAVVAAISANTEVPRADDYRYLLRNMGYQVVNITEHAQAEQLVMILEVPEFEWQKWTNFEIDSFGAKKVITAETYGNSTVIVFSKE